MVQRKLRTNIQTRVQSIQTGLFSWNFRYLDLTFQINQINYQWCLNCFRYLKKPLIDFLDISLLCIFISLFIFHCPFPSQSLSIYFFYVLIIFHVHSNIIWNKINCSILPVNLRKEHKYKALQTVNRISLWAYSDHFLKSHQDIQSHGFYNRWLLISLCAHME